MSAGPLWFCISVRSISPGLNPKGSKSHTLGDTLTSFNGKSKFCKADNTPYQLARRENLSSVLMGCLRGFGALFLFVFSIKLDLVG
jgi:hypothetical protein